MDRLTLIKSPITVELEEFKRIFDSSLSSSNALLDEVTAYIQQRNGKMMRPVLVLLVSKLYGAVSSKTLHAAVALELLHTASLVHDDVVDESDQRRGQPSVNALYNNKIAVLVGDFLMATCLIQAAKTENVRIIDTISCLGRDLSEGELLQLSNISNPQLSEEVYFDVIRKKTAALFAACTQIATLSIHASDAICERARLLGEYIGICFQIKDDIFDYYDSKAIGKPTGNDMLEGKLTLPALYVLNSTDERWVKALAMKVKSGSASADEIDQLVTFTKDNGGIEYAQKVMYSYYEKALSILDEVGESPIKTSLVAYLDHVIGREN